MRGRRLAGRPSGRVRLRRGASAAARDTVEAKRRRGTSVRGHLVDAVVDERGADVAQALLALRDHALGGEQAYLAGQARLRLKQNSEARAAFKRLASGSDDSAWTWIGRSALAQLERNRGEALDAAKRAVSLDKRLAEAHYQLGLVYNDRGDFKEAAGAFADAVKQKPTMAYAHYYAGAANNKIKRMDRMANHFERFVKLAPDAPERPAVESMLRTARR